MPLDYYLFITRPGQAGAELSADINYPASPLGKTIFLPSLSVSPLEDQEAIASLEAVLARLKDFDLAIFVSANAIRFVFERLTSPWSELIATAVTGEGSARALRAKGVSRIFCPQQQFDSEGLWECLESAQFRPKRVLIFRAQKGREWLSDQFRQRGIEVATAICYRRIPITQISPTTEQALREAIDSHKPLFWLITSLEGAEALIDLIPADLRHALIQGISLVPHPRIAKYLKSIGCTQVPITPPSGEAIKTTIERWIQERQF